MRVFFFAAPSRRTGLVSRMGLMGAAALASCIAILVALLCGRGGSAWCASLAPFVANSLLAVAGAAAFIWRCLRLEALPSMAWEGRPRGVLRRHATGARRRSRLIYCMCVCIFLDPTMHAPHWVVRCWGAREGVGPRFVCGCKVLRAFDASSPFASRSPASPSPTRTSRK